MTESTNMHWGVTSWGGVSFDQETDYENNRIQKTGWEFDNDGRNTKAITDSSATILTAFDAAGRVIQRSGSSGLTRTYYDGNGKKLTSTSPSESQKYLIRSSLMKGQVISEVWGNGRKYRSYVKGVGNQTAVQTAYASATATLNESVLFEYSDVLGMSYRTTDKNAAAVATGDGGEGSPIETDPLGGSVGTMTPYFEPVIYEPEPEYPELQPYIIGEQGPMMQDFGSLYSTLGSRIADLPGFGTNWGSLTDLYMEEYDQRVWNAWMGIGFVTNEELGLPPGIRITSAIPIWDDVEDADDDESDLNIITGTEIIGWNVIWDEDWDWGALTLREPFGIVQISQRITNDPPRPTENQCKAIRELIRREKEHGTFKASRMSSIESGGETKLTYLQNEISGIVHVGLGPLDIDWLITLNSVDPKSGVTNPFPGPSAGPTLLTYAAGKAIWTGIKKVRGEPTQNPWPFQEEAEVNAVRLSMIGAKYGDIFNEKWLKANCNYPSEAAQRGE